MGYHFSTSGREVVPHDSKSDLPLLTYVHESQKENYQSLQMIQQNFRPVFSHRRAYYNQTYSANCSKLLKFLFVFLKNIVSIWCLRFDGKIYLAIETCAVVHVFKIRMIKKTEEKRVKCPLPSILVYRYSGVLNNRTALNKRKGRKTAEKNKRTGGN